MQLFILRHGQAEPQSTTDEARNLTAQGRADVAAITGSSLIDLHLINEIWASPLVRAQQTAQIVQEVLHAQGQYVAIKTTPLIIPDGDVVGLFEALQSSSAQSILLASHQPFVGDLLDRLCGQASGFHPMNTSSLACVDVSVAADGLGILRWLRHVHG